MNLKRGEAARREQKQSMACEWYYLVLPWWAADERRTRAVFTAAVAAARVANQSENVKREERAGGIEERKRGKSASEG
jgi:hypothetical protein